MKLVTSVLGGIGLSAVASLFTLGGCGGDKSAPLNSLGGANANVGGGNPGGNTSANTSAGGSTSTAGAAAVGGGTACVPKAVPDNGTITNFSEVAAGPSYGYAGSTTATNFSWGTSTTLTGGTFFYVPNEADGVTPKTSDGITVAIANGAAVLTANIPVGDYSGFGFYFGPDSGSDATAFTGISFTILGDVGGASVDVQLQMNEDYPVTDPSSPGKCPKGSCAWDHAPDASVSKWSSCSNPHTALGVTVSSAVQTVQLSWGLFKGGKQTDALNAGGLLGLQFQFNCPTGATAACAPNVTIDDVMFYH